MWISACSIRRVHIQKHNCFQENSRKSHHSSPDTKGINNNNIKRDINNFYNKYALK